MKADIKIDGKGILNFLKSRKVVLENNRNQTIFDIQLLWVLVAMFFFSGLIITGIIICLLLGCKVSIVDTTRDFFGKDNNYK